MKLGWKKSIMPETKPQAEHCGRKHRRLNQKIYEEVTQSRREAEIRIDNPSAEFSK